MITLSVLFNEPKLLKCSARNRRSGRDRYTVSVLFNEPKLLKLMEADMVTLLTLEFQCSSTSRNC